MEKNLQNLIKNGFIICPQENKFIVEKIAVEGNSDILNPIEFETYELALEFAIYRLNPVKECQPIVRYTRGLGIEYKNLPIILAENREKALNIAKNESELLKECQILEVKVFPKFDV